MSKLLIAKLDKNSELREAIVKWIVQEEYDQLYKKCNAGLSEECLGVGLRETFHGKRCNECRKTYKNELNHEKRSNKKRKGSVSFKKGTKKK
jgi:hypothetical protein